MVECEFFEGALSERINKNATAIPEQMIGATAVFEGTVRADKIDNKKVVCIDFSTQKEIAHSIAIGLLKASKEKFMLNSATIYHSIGKVEVGQICFRVEVKAAHRKETFQALPEIVDEFKANVPIFGKEIFEDYTYAWKQNRK